MDQTELIDKVQEKILNNLPDEAIQKLANLVDQGDDYDAEVQNILDSNQIDVKKIIAETMEENHAQ